eukprot:359061-Chlamydomonas_euryale.AAC.4
MDNRSYFNEIQKCKKGFAAPQASAFAASAAYAPRTAAGPRAAPQQRRLAGNGGGGGGDWADDGSEDTSASLHLDIEGEARLSRGGWQKGWLADGLADGLGGIPLRLPEGKGGGGGREGTCDLTNCGHGVPGVRAHPVAPCGDPTLRLVLVHRYMARETGCAVSPLEVMRRNMPGNDQYADFHPGNTPAHNDPALVPSFPFRTWRSLRW